MGNGPPALEGAVVVVTLGGGVEGAARGLASKRKREGELTHTPNTLEVEPVHNLF